MASISSHLDPLPARAAVYALWSIHRIVGAVKETLAERFGRCVRQLRLDEGMTQVEFGERCGFYQTYLSRLERGQANPTLNAMEVIAASFVLSGCGRGMRVEAS